MQVGALQFGVGVVRPLRTVSRVPVEGLYMTLVSFGGCGDDLTGFAAPSGGHRRRTAAASGLPQRWLTPNP